MELITPEKLEKEKVLSREQAKLILKQLKEGKKEDRERGIFLVEVIFSLLLRGKSK